jgi:hypothetical protein
MVCETGRPEVTLAKVHSDVLLGTGCIDCHKPTAPAATKGPGDYTSVQTTTTAFLQSPSAYTKGTDGVKIVDPGNLANSTLWLMVLGGAEKGYKSPKGDPIGPGMPQSRDPLEAEHKQLIKDWICGGAK